MFIVQGVVTNISFAAQGFASAWDACSTAFAGPRRRRTGRPVTGASPARHPRDASPGDAYPEAVQLPKGDYTLRLALRHESLELLEKMRGTCIVVVGAG